jgi:hypothetical protein
MFGFSEVTVGAVGGEPPTTGGFVLNVWEREPPPPHAVTARQASVTSTSRHRLRVGGIVTSTESGTVE